MPWHYACSRGRRGAFKQAVSEQLERIDGIRENDDDVDNAIGYAQDYGSCQDICASLRNMAEELMDAGIARGAAKRLYLA